jgi:crotonobetainyl-CoA:carnitine CoA-transferase CaiB-like acyl-CoA transferase
VVLDLGDDQDLAAAHELTRRADIMVQNFKPGGLARFGLDYAAVQARNPAIVYASISGFGAGAGSALPGYDVLVQAVSGLMSLTGDPDGPPYRAGISLVDILAGLHATVGILAALQHRSQTGDGQHVEVNLLSSALSGMANQSSAYAAGGVVPMRMGNLHPSLTPYEPLPTSDGDLVIAVGNDVQFGRLCAVLGAPGLADDPRFAQNAGRTSHRAELRAELANRLAARTSAEWSARLTEAGIPCGPINTVAGGVATAAELGLVPIVTAGDGPAGIPGIRHPITLSATPPDYPLPPPALDEHGEQLRAWLAAPPRGARPSPIPDGESI